MSSKSCAHNSALIIGQNSFLALIIEALFLSACSKYKVNDPIPRFSVYLKTNAKNGNPKKQCELAQCYMFGLNVEKTSKLLKSGTAKRLSIICMKRSKSGNA